MYQIHLQEKNLFQRVHKMKWYTKSSVWWTQVGSSNWVESKEGYIWCQAFVVAYEIIIQV